VEFRNAVTNPQAPIPPTSGATSLAAEIRESPGEPPPAGGTVANGGPPPPSGSAAAFSGIPDTAQAYP
jgi:hypothetical protein